jgi:hypothetical protein
VQRLVWVAAAAFALGIGIFSLIVVNSGYLQLSGVEKHGPGTRPARGNEQAIPEEDKSWPISPEQAPWPPADARSAPPRPLPE